MIFRTASVWKQAEILPAAVKVHLKSAPASCLATHDIFHHGELAITASFVYGLSRGIANRSFIECALRTARNCYLFSSALCAPAAMKYEKHLNNNLYFMRFAACIRKDGDFFVSVRALCKFTRNRRTASTPSETDTPYIMQRICSLRSTLAFRWRGKSEFPRVGVEFGGICRQNFAC